MKTEKALDVIYSRYGDVPAIVDLIKEVRDLQASLKRHQDKLLEVSAKHVAAEKVADRLKGTLERNRSVFRGCCCVHYPGGEVCTKCETDATLVAYREWKKRGATESKDD